MYGVWRKTEGLPELETGSAWKADELTALRVRPPPLPLCLWCKGSTLACEADGAGSNPVRHLRRLVHERARKSHASVESQLATDPRDDRGPGTRHALEQRGESRRP
jgi:hypothetical protein